MKAFKPSTMALGALAWLIAVSNGNGQDGDQKPTLRPRTMVQTRALSAEELIKKSKTIFSGRVERVSTEPLELGNGRSLDIKVVTFLVEERKKGDLKAGDRVTYRLSPMLDVPIRVNEELVWYLPEPGELGLVAPLGLHSGFFRVSEITLPNRSVIKVAENLKSNRGLFPKNAQISPNEVTVAAGNLPNVEDANQVMRAYAEKAGDNGPVPLQLLFSVTESRLKN